MKYLQLLFVAFILVACNTKVEKKLATQSEQNLETKILFILSNQSTYGNSSLETSNHFAEIVLAYDVLVNEGYQIDFVSPKGGSVPVGYLDTTSVIQNKYLNDANFMKRLKSTKSPSDVVSSEYKAVYYSGGGAAMFGVPENEAIQKITMDIYEKNEGVVSAICHGSAGLANLKTKDGKYIYQGKQVNGYPDKFERMDADYYQTFPFSIEGILKDRGGNFTFSEEGWDDYMVADGRLITGQDPSASASVARKIIETLSK